MKSEFFVTEQNFLFTPGFSSCFFLVLSIFHCSQMNFEAISVNVSFTSWQVLKFSCDFPCRSQCKNFHFEGNTYDKLVVFTIIFEKNRKFCCSRKRMTKELL